MPVLASKDLRRRLRDLENAPDSKIVITPLLDNNQIGAASVDVRLGNEFIIIRHTILPSVDPTRRQEIREKVRQYQERTRAGFREPFVLHPHQLVLGSTLEYISLPLDLTAQVMGRSSWGRLGLIIATATSIAPGFKGVITLELINAGQAPLILYPGVVIAQLVFTKLQSKAKYRGRYDWPTGPQFTRIYEDKDLDFWKEQAKENVSAPSKK